MTTTITPAPIPGVLDRLTVERDRYRSDADRIAAEIVISPTVDDLNRAEEELLVQLADVRRRRSDRAIRDSEHRAAAEAAEFFDGLIGRTRTRIEQGPAAVLDRPRPDPDPLAGLPGLVGDARDEVAAVTGGYPVVPVVPVASTPPVSSGPSGVPGPAELAEKTREGLRLLDAPGDVVATAGPGFTMPDASAQPVQSVQPAPPVTAAPVQAGARHSHKRGSRK